MSDVKLRLVVFDVDGTLVDSQGDILVAMTAAFAAVGLPVPERAKALSIVGLSLDRAIQTLTPDLTDKQHSAMVQAYRDAYVDLRAQNGAAQSSPLYPGARDVLDSLRQQPEVLLGVATGKSKRGLDKLIEGHDLQGYFITQQVADFHPSKPHPSMLIQAMADAGVTAEQTVMIGDTSFDMDMAAAAGVHGIGVSWGYHPTAQLQQAGQIIDSFAELPDALNSIWRATE